MRFIHTKSYTLGVSNIYVFIRLKVWHRFETVELIVYIYIFNQSIQFNAGYHCDPCLNSGLCTDDSTVSGGYTCSCAQEYSFHMCEIVGK